MEPVDQAPQGFAPSSGWATVAAPTATRDEVVPAKRPPDTLSRMRLVSRALNQSPPLSEALEILVRQGLRPMDVEAGVVGLLRPNRTLQVVATMGMGDNTLSRFLALGLDDRVPLTDAAARGAPVWLHDLAELDHRYPQLASLPDRAEASASLPLVVDNQVVGALGIACGRPMRFATEDRIFLLTVADIFAGYLDRMGLVHVDGRLGADTDTDTDTATDIDVQDEPAGPTAVGPASRRSGTVGRLSTLRPPRGRQEPRRSSASTKEIDLRSEASPAADDASRDIRLLASFIAHSPIALALFDRELRFVIANDKLAEINGRPVPDHIGRTLGEVVPQLAAQNERLMNRVLRTDTPIEGVEVSGPTDGRPEGGDWLVNYYPVRDADGAVFGVGATVVDVTGTNRRERLLQEAFAERDHIAQVLQQSLLPITPPQLPGLAIAMLYLPAGAGNAVGGDFYDVFSSENSYHVVVGDVCGQGAEAAALTGFARDTLRATTVLDDNPVNSLVHLNDLLLERSSDSRFITVAHLVVDRTEEGSLGVALAGHPHPLLVRHGQVTELGTPGSLLGVHRRVHIEARPARLEPGDVIVIYTDGLTDQARDPMGRAELHQLFAELGHLPPGKLVETVREYLVERRSGATADDTLVVAMRVEAQ